jgi:hypothetical protein
MIVVFALKCQLKPKNQFSTKNHLQLVYVLFFKENIAVDAPKILDSCLKMKHSVLPFELDRNTGMFDLEGRNKNKKKLKRKTKTNQNKKNMYKRCI